MKERSILSKTSTVVRLIKSHGILIQVLHRSLLFINPFILCFHRPLTIEICYWITGCNLANPGNFTGTAGSTNCDANINNNAGCGVLDQSVASFGETFNEKGGGIYAMKWDESSIDICK